MLTSEEVVQLDQNDKPCEHDINYDWTKCIFNVGAKFVGCSLNWFRNDSNYQSCTTVKQMKKMQEFFKSMKLMKSLESFDCLFPCSRKHYKIKEIVQLPITWVTPWVSEVKIDLSELVYEKKKEYFVYDQVKEVCTDEQIDKKFYLQGDLLGDIGGYLGFFLGWSCLSILLKTFQRIPNVRYLFDKG